MIRELLDPVVVRKAAETLLDFLDRERAALKRRDGDTLDAAADAKASQGDLDNAEKAVQDWQHREVEEVEGADGGKPPIWVSRDPIASLIQSTFEEFFLDHGLIRALKGSGLANDVPAI